MELLVKGTFGGKSTVSDKLETGRVNVVVRLVRIPRVYFRDGE